MVTEHIMKTYLTPILLASLVMLSSSFTTQAEEAPKIWSGNVQLGYSGTGGNTTDNNVNGKFNLNYNKEKWTNTYKLEALYSDSNSEVTAERYSGTFQWNYKIARRYFLFANNNTVFDQFNTYDKSYTSALGFGKRLIEGGKITLDAQIGPGYRYAHIAGTNKCEEDFVGTASSTLSWIISKTANFSQSLSIDDGHNNVQTKWESALSLNVIGNLGMQVSYAITNNSTIPADSDKTKKTDYRTDITLLYGF
jgi:putative salt-induced outer membrane protein YdiY